VANTPSARKRARQNVKRRQHNREQISRVRTAVKATLAAIEAGDGETASRNLRDTQSLLDRAADKGLIAKNKAARHKRRLNAKVKAIVTAN